MKGIAFQGAAGFARHLKQFFDFKYGDYMAENLFGAICKRCGTAITHPDGLHHFSPDLFLKKAAQNFPEEGSLRAALYCYAGEMYPPSRCKSIGGRDAIRLFCAEKDAGFFLFS